jgi:ATP synthase protein I
MVALCGALVCYAMLDARAAVSALIGGGIGAVATLVQVLVGLRNSAGKEPRAVVSGFYRGSVMKLIVTVVLFMLALKALAIQGRSPAPAPLFVTYVATFVVYWLALARSFRAGAQQEAMRSMKDQDR